MKRSYKVVGLDCANCAAKIERKLNEVDGVTEATVNFMTTKMTFEYDEAKQDAVIAAVEKIVAEVEPDATLKRC